MQLSDHQIRDINKYIQQGKPLPDEYRFLLFENEREVELVWNGKNNEVTNVVLPFQTIEQVDEPRSETDTKSSIQMSLFDLDTRGRQLHGWTNKLIWGDNKLILSGLKNGYLREDIEKQGGLKLVYIDPPFSAGLDYSIDVHIGDTDQSINKSPSVIEEFAYRNTWGNGGNTFIQMLFERIQLIKDLLSENGVLFFRIDHHWGHYSKIMLDEVFGKDYFIADLIVNRIRKNVTSQGKLSMPVATDSVFVYAKSDQFLFKHLNKKLKEVREGYWRRTDDSAGERRPRERLLFGKVFEPPAGKHFKFSQNTMEQMILNGKLRFNERLARLEYFVEPTENAVLDTNWTDIPGYSFNTGYPTENSEQLLARVIDISTQPGDLVADFFCGSGTTLAVAEKLGRKWIGTDIGKFSIHTTRKRMLEVQRGMKKEGKDYRAFEILNIGKYERQHYVTSDQNLTHEENETVLANKEKAFINLILSAYKAEPLAGFVNFHGKKASRVVCVGSINLPISTDLVKECIIEALDKKITKVDILGFEFEMGLTPRMQEEAKEQGIDLSLKYIPRDVFDKRAIDRNQVVFYDVSYIEVKPVIKSKSIAIELVDFSVFYNQDSIANVEESLGKGSNKIVVENGQIIKVLKDKNGIVTKEVLTKEWTDWIDYWAVDFDYTSKKEFIRLRKNENKQEKLLGEKNLEQGKLIQDYIEQWTGDYIFENEWQSFRTKKDRNLELRTVFHEYPSKGRYKIAVKVIDIFGNDTTKVIEVSI